MPQGGGSVPVGKEGIEDAEAYIKGIAYTVECPGITQNNSK